MSDRKMDKSWISNDIDRGYNTFCEGEDCGKVAKYRFRPNDADEGKYSDITHLCKGHIATKFGISISEMPDTNNETRDRSPDVEDDPFETLYE